MELIYLQKSSVIGCKKMPIEAGLYIHIPFCLHHCGYCAFAVTEKNNKNVEYHRSYLNALEQELATQLPLYRDYQFSTLYIGGGTPSILHLNEIKNLFDKINSYFPKTTWKEISFECNPEDITPELCQLLDSLGVTRLSIGIQTLSQIGQQCLERFASNQKIYDMVEMIPNNFKGDISYDFVLAWPGQSLELFKKDDLAFLTKTHYHHLSVYLLNYEPGTRLERDHRLGKVDELDGDIAADIWDCWLEASQGMGMDRYEISSFCFGNKKSLHNVNTWQGSNYLGIGAGAVSALPGKRWTNAKTPDLYIKKILAEGTAVTNKEEIFFEKAWKETLLLSLRYKDGLTLDSFINKYNLNLENILHNQFSFAREQKHLILSDSKLKFTSKGWDYFDTYLSDWMLKIEDHLDH